MGKASRQERQKQLAQTPVGVRKARLLRYYVHYLLRISERSLLEELEKVRMLREIADQMSAEHCAEN